MCLLDDDSGLSISLIQRRRLFAGFAAARRTMMQNWCAPHMCGDCDESVASPLIISISPSLIRRPSPGSRREWVCERGGALKQPGLAACDEAHLKGMEPHHRRCYMPSAPLLWRPVSSPCMHAGVLVGPGRER